MCAIALVILVCSTTPAIAVPSTPFGFMPEALSQSMKPKAKSLNISGNIGDAYAVASSKLYDDVAFAIRDLQTQFEGLHDQHLRDVAATRLTGERVLGEQQAAVTHENSTNARIQAVVESLDNHISVLRLRGGEIQRHIDMMLRDLDDLHANLSTATDFADEAIHSARNRDKSPEMKVLAELVAQRRKALVNKARSKRWPNTPEELGGRKRSHALLQTRKVGGRTGAGVESHTVANHAARSKQTASDFQVLGNDGASPLSIFTQYAAQLASDSVAMTQQLEMQAQPNRQRPPGQKRAENPVAPVVKVKEAAKGLQTLQTELNGLSKLHERQLDKLGDDLEARFREGNAAITKLRQHQEYLNATHDKLVTLAPELLKSVRNLAETRLYLVRQYRAVRTFLKDMGNQTQTINEIEFSVIEQGGKWKFRRGGPMSAVRRKMSLLQSEKAGASARSNKSSFSADAFALPTKLEASTPDIEADAAYKAVAGHMSEFESQILRGRVSTAASFMTEQKELEDELMSECQKNVRTSRENANIMDDLKALSKDNKLLEDEAHQVDRRIQAVADDIQAAKASVVVAQSFIEQTVQKASETKNANSDVLNALEAKEKAQLRQREHEKALTAIRDGWSILSDPIENSLFEGLSLLSTRRLKTKPPPQKIPPTAKAAPPAQQRTMDMAKLEIKKQAPARPKKASLEAVAGGKDSSGGSEAKPKADAPQPKAVVPQHKEDAPQPKAVAPQPKAVTPQPKADAPQHKEVVPQHKAVVPQPKAVAPQPKAVAPQPKAVAPQPKAVAPQPKGVSPQPQAVAPQPIAVAPQLKAVAPQPAGGKKVAPKSAAPNFLTPKPVPSKTNTPRSVPATTAISTPVQAKSSTPKPAPGKSPPKTMAAQPKPVGAEAPVVDSKRDLPAIVAASADGGDRNQDADKYSVHDEGDASSVNMDASSKGGEEESEDTDGSFPVSITSVDDIMGEMQSTLKTIEGLQVTSEMELRSRFRSAKNSCIQSGVRLKEERTILDRMSKAATELDRKLTTACQSASDLEGSMLSQARSLRVYIGKLATESVAVEGVESEAAVAISLLQMSSRVFHRHTAHIPGEEDEDPEQPFEQDTTDTFRSVASRANALQQRLQDMEMESKQKLARHKSEYARKLTDMTEANQKLSSSVQQIAGENQALKANNMRLRHQAGDLLKDIESLNSDLMIMKGNLSNAADFVGTTLQSVAAKKNKELDVIKELDDADRASSERRDKQRRLGEISSSGDHPHTSLLQIKIADSPGELLRGLEGGIGQLTSESDTLESKAKAEFQEEAKRKRDQHAKLLSEKDAKLSENRALRLLQDRLKSAVSILEESRTQLEERSKSLRNFAKRVSERPLPRLSSTSHEQDHEPSQKEKVVELLNDDRVSHTHPLRVVQSLIQAEDSDKQSGNLLSWLTR